MPNTIRVTGEAVITAFTIPIAVLNTPRATAIPVITIAKVETKSQLLTIQLITDPIASATFVRVSWIAGPCSFINASI